MKKANRREKNHGSKPPAQHTKNEMPHVIVSRKPDQADQADRAGESAAFDGQAQLLESDRTLSEADQTWTSDQAEHHNWSRTPNPAKPSQWAKRLDVIMVVEDLAAEGKRVEQITRLLGLTRVEVR
jgi:hypothetical protein